MVPRTYCLKSHASTPPRMNEIGRRVPNHFMELCTLLLFFVIHDSDSSFSFSLIEFHRSIFLQIAIAPWIDQGQMIL